MKIAAFFSGMQHARSMSGGDRHGLEVWKAWRNLHAAQVVVLCPIQGRELCDYFGYQFTFVLSEKRRSTVSANRLGYLRRFSAALLHVGDLNEPDVVYASSPYFYDVLPAIVLKRRRRGAKLLVPVFHLIPRPGTRGGAFLVNALAWVEQRLMLRLISVFADLVITDNPGVRDALCARGIASDRIIVSKMGVAKADAVPPEHLLRSRTAVSVGRLTPAKGVDQLLRAWACVAGHVPNATLVLVGNAAPGYDVEKDIAKLELEGSVRVLSGLNDDEVQEVLSSARFFVTASQEEGYGLAVQEALARGVPCVTFDVPAFAHAFPRGRKIAASSDAPALAEAMRQMFDDGVLAAVARSNEQNSFFTWDQVAEEIWQRCAP